MGGLFRDGGEREIPDLCLSGNLGLKKPLLYCTELYNGLYCTVWRSSPQK